MPDLIGRLHADSLAAGFRALAVTPDTVEEIGDHSGAYLLALHLPRSVTLAIGQRPSRAIASGCYVYAGSAYGPGGLRARLRRHLKPIKSVHWHIDRLTTRADAMVALAIPGGHECALVESLLKTRRFEIAVPGFGSSDCRDCEGHLLSPARRNR